MDMSDNKAIVAPHTWQDTASDLATNRWVESALGVAALGTVIASRGKLTGAVERYLPKASTLLSLTEGTIKGYLPKASSLLELAGKKSTAAGELISDTKAVKSDLIHINPPIEFSRAMKFNASASQQNALRDNFETVSGAFSQMKPFESSKSYQEIQAALKEMSEGTSVKLSANALRTPTSEAYVIGDVEIATGEKTLPRFNIPSVDDIGAHRITVPIEPKVGHVAGDKLPSERTLGASNAVEKLLVETGLTTRTQSHTLRFAKELLHPEILKSVEASDVQLIKTTPGHETALEKPSDRMQLFYNSYPKDGTRSLLQELASSPDLDTSIFREYKHWRVFKPEVHE
ncbi:MAG: hypothetical protein P4L53_29320 [Candidatus Obscuribacterales bacterium]|nr:hypothetical protein [Candidatus Obscuribacterales bacterium]